jgi:hypothetical protein
MTSPPDQITQLCLTLALFCGASFTAAQTGAARITTASGVRLRTAPQTRADEVTRLPLGAVVQAQEQSPGKENIGQSEAFWYRVITADGKSGWMFGSFSVPFDPAQREAIYQRLAAERLKVEQANFAELSDLVNFLTRAATETTTPAVTAELELSRLLALGRSLLNLAQTNADAKATCRAASSACCSAKESISNFIRRARTLPKRSATLMSCSNSSAKTRSSRRFQKSPKKTARNSANSSHSCCALILKTGSPKQGCHPQAT